ncbi:MAG TPA: leucyl aminopeptidase [Dermatophilaceae bacterium]|nr:leucyl aminopeptidase [Dermatophilaceae bacterium]
MPILTLTDEAPEVAVADVLVVFARPRDPATGPPNGSPAPAPPELCTAAPLPALVSQHVLSSLATLRAKGAADEVTLLASVPGVAAPLVAVTGLGGHTSAAATAPESVRRAAGAAARAVAGRPSAALLPPSDDEPGVAAAAEGFSFGAYDFTRHRGTGGAGGARGSGDAATEGSDPAASIAGHVKSSPPVSRVSIHVAPVASPAADRPDLEIALVRAAVLGRAVGWARDLVNTAPNALSPQSFADAVVTRAAEFGAVEVDVLDESELARERCAGLLAVGMGSSRPPRLVVMRYRPTTGQSRLAFVGKGITFDSGGLCIKPAASMITMKDDMAGAAAVAAAILAAAELALPVQIDGYLCLAENMPSATAQRPGDVLTMRDGTTVEVINTDAEGRLVLADGLCLAGETDPDAIVDVATLTGAAITALGRRTAAVLANDEAVQGELALAATSAGESVWPMPIPEEIRADLDSLVADLKHTGDNVGGCLVAAAFLREFVGGPHPDVVVPWGHLDIAGPAYHEGKPYGYTPKGGTGAAVRTLIAFAEGRAVGDERTPRRVGP